MIDHNKQPYCESLEEGLRLQRLYKVHQARRHICTQPSGQTAHYASLPLKAPLCAYIPGSPSAYPVSTRSSVPFRNSFADFSNHLDKYSKCFYHSGFYLSLSLLIWKHNRLWGKQTNNHYLSVGSEILSYFIIFLIHSCNTCHIFLCLSHTTKGQINIKCLCLLF